MGDDLDWNPPKFSFATAGTPVKVCQPTLLGCGQVGKALVFGTRYRGFESYHPSFSRKKHAYS